MYIYKTTDLTNGKIYVGCSMRSIQSSIEYLGSGRLLLNIIKKRGRHNFKKEILQECEDVSELANAERYWIAKLDCRNPEIGYNLDIGGGLIFKPMWKYKTDGTLVREFDTIIEAIEEIDDKNIYRSNIRMSRPIQGHWYFDQEVDKETVKEAHARYLQRLNENMQNGIKKRYSNPKYLKQAQEHMRKIGKLVKNHSISDETKQKISESLAGRKWYYDPETGEAGQYHECPTGWKSGRKEPLPPGPKKPREPMSDHARQNISAARKGIIFTEEHRQNLSNAHQGKVLSEEHKKQISSAHKEGYKSGRIQNGMSKRVGCSNGETYGSVSEAARSTDCQRYHVTIAIESGLPCKRTGLSWFWV